MCHSGAAPLAGVIADRFSPGRLLAVGWLIQAVLAGFVALRLPARAREAGGGSCPSFVRDARDGIAFVWRTPYVLAVAAGFWVVVLFSAPDDLILPFLAAITFKAGPVAVGVLLAGAPWLIAAFAAQVLRGLAIPWRTVT